MPGPRGRACFCQYVLVLANYLRRLGVASCFNMFPRRGIKHPLSASHTLSLPPSLSPSFSPSLSRSLSPTLSVEGPPTFPTPEMSSNPFPFPFPLPPPAAAMGGVKGTEGKEGKEGKEAKHARPSSIARISYAHGSIHGAARFSCASFAAYIWRHPPAREAAARRGGQESVVVAAGTRCRRARGRSRPRR